MSHAEKCPVCNGKGVVNNVQPADTVMARWEQCPACLGQCIVYVPDEQPIFYSGLFSTISIQSDRWYQ